MQARISVILPARNEAASIAPTIRRLRNVFPDAQVIVVDDGSTDRTAANAHDAGASLVIPNPYTVGNGGAIKRGCRAADGEILVFMDADGQHDPAEIPKLLERLEEGHDMIVGARRSNSQANWGRGLANRFYNWLASYMTGHRILDLTSGFRAVRADKFREFLYLLPNGFSYPTTITMAFFRAGYPVGYIPITAAKREGKSHIHPLKDGIRFLLIIFKVATLYSPLKVFVPISAGFFLLGLGYYLYTFITEARFTNMSGLLLTTSILVFLIGLVSEQITALMYRKEG